MFDRFQRSWDLAAECWRLLMDEKSLLVFPLMSSIAMVLIIGSFAVPLLPAFGFAAGRAPHALSALGYLAMFAFYWIQYAIVIFFNTALVEVAMRRFDDEEAGIADGLRRAAALLPVILVYALIAATVGTVLRAIAERVGIIGRIVVALVGVGWTVATALVVPILAAENVGPVEAIGRSAELVKKSWGENIIGNDRHRHGLRRDHVPGRNHRRACWSSPRSATANGRWASCWRSYWCSPSVSSQLRRRRCKAFIRPHCIASPPEILRPAASTATCSRMPSRPSPSAHPEPVQAVAEFRFYEELNDFLRPELRKRTFSQGFNGAPAVKDVIEAIGVPHAEVDLVLIDGESVNLSRRLHDGNRVAVYPMFERLDIAPLTRVRPRPLRRSRFVLDVHLGTLARYLRLLGFDTLYRNDYDDHEIVRRGARPVAHHSDARQGLAQTPGRHPGALDPPHEADGAAA